MKILDDTISDLSHQVSFTTTSSICNISTEAQGISPDPWSTSLLKNMQKDLLIKSLPESHKRPNVHVTSTILVSRSLVMLVSLFDHNKSDAFCILLDSINIFGSLNSYSHCFLPQLELGIHAHDAPHKIPIAVIPYPVTDHDASTPITRFCSAVGILALVMFRT